MCALIIYISGQVWNIHNFQSQPSYNEHEMIIIYCGNEWILLAIPIFGNGSIGRSLAKDIFSASHM